MTTYGGGFFKSPIQIERTYDQVDTIGVRRDFQESPEGLNTSANFKVGSFDDTQPAELVSDVDRGGGKFRSFFDDYYNRVYFIPPTIDFGAISATSTKSITVWNAHLNSVTLQSIDITNGEGLSVDGESLPYAFNPLGTTIYQITATTVGPASVDATFTFTFDPAESFDLKAVGERAKLSPLVPNWDSSYTIEYRFKTDIFTSESGKEQRRALRSTPRKVIRFAASPHGSAFRAMNSIMASWHNNTIIMPELPRRVAFKTNLSAGSSTVILAETPPRWLVAGVPVILSHGGEYESRKVASVDGDSVTFSGVSLKSWSAGTYIHPSLSGRFAVTVQSKRLTNQVANVSVELGVTPASEPIIAIPDAPKVFNGRELFMKKHNWAEEPDVSYVSLREELDYGRGRTSVFTPVAFSERNVKLTFVGRDYDEAEELTDFFKRMKGQLGEFYAPTWEPDILISTTAFEGTRNIRIAGTDFAKEFSSSTVYKAVAVFMNDGSTYLRKVQSIIQVDDDDGQDSVIQTDENWPVDLTPENVRMISWLLVWRHATDALQMEWLTDSVAQCQFSLKTLEDLA